jgi:hypothetical protein
MTVIQHYNHIVFDNVSYSIFPIMYKGKKVPVIIDTKDFKYIKNLNKSWYINDSGSVVCQHTLNDNVIELYTISS